MNTFHTNAFQNLWRRFLVACLVSFVAHLACCLTAEAESASSQDSVVVSADTESNDVPIPSETPAAVMPTAAANVQHCIGSHVDIEDLNLLGADVTVPAFADSVTGISNPMRVAMLCHNFTYRITNMGSFAANTLQRPVNGSEQAYVGQRPTWSAGSYTGINTDLRSFHLSGYQLTLGAFFTHNSWQPAAPSAVKMSMVTIYKPFFHHRLEFKTGYQSNDMEFIGMQVGGSVSSGQSGVYAVLPFEVGLAFMPLAAPTFTIRAQPKGNFYGKAGLQRSASPLGGMADIARDSAGFRFAPKGDGLLSIFEGGYKRDSEKDVPEFWVRGGYLTNTTKFPNAKTGLNSSGNNCTFLLVDRELSQDDPADTDNGFYIGGSFVTAPPEYDAYSRYYELRLYKNGPFHRMNDMAALVSSYTSFSRYTTANAIAAGQTIGTHAATMSASYSVRLGPGTYLSNVLSYNSRPAIIPRLPEALIFTTQLSLFF